MNTPKVKNASGDINVIIVVSAVLITLVIGLYFFFQKDDDIEKIKTPSPSYVSLSPSDNTPAPQEDATQEEILQTLFKTIDKDNNDVISFDEMFLEMGPDASENTRNTNQQIFNSLDIDNSGSLSMAEFTSGNIKIQ